MKTKAFEPEFVTTIPSRIEPGLVYVSIEYATAVHLCACGCGAEVVTPLSPTDWTVSFDGKDISLDPSIGNWSFPCRSHYWIRSGRVLPAPAWSDERVRRGREFDRRRKAGMMPTEAVQSKVRGSESAHRGWLERLFAWLRD